LMKSKGLSAAVAALAAVTFLVLGLYMSILVLQRTGRGGMAQMAGIHRGIGEKRRGLRIFIEPTDNNGTMIRFVNEWGDVVRIDYLVVTDKHGKVKLRLEGEDIPTPLRYMIPGGEMVLKPSEIGLQTRYDGDYWKMKREISQIIVHTEDGNLFASIYGRPPSEIYPIYIETTWTFTDITTIVTTTTTTSWTTTTITTTKTTYV